MRRGATFGWRSCFCYPALVPTPLNPGDRWAIAPVLANYVLGVNDAGFVAWTPNRPEPGGGATTAGGLYVINEWGGGPRQSTFGSFVSGSTGAAGFSITAGDEGARTPTTTYGGIPAANTTTSNVQSTSSGNAGSQTFFFSSGSGTWTWDALLSVTAIDGVLTLLWTGYFGFNDAISAAAVDAAAFVILDGSNANWQCRVTANSVSTTTDSGVAIVAGTSVRLRVQVTNNTSVSFWIVNDTPTSSNPFSGAATVTIATNIPSGSSRGTDVGLDLFTTPSTTTLTAINVPLVFQQARRQPIDAAVTSRGGVVDDCLNPGDGLGLPLGYVGQQVRVSEAGVPHWDERYPPVQSIITSYRDVSGCNEYGSGISGTGAAITQSATPVSGQPPDYTLSTGTTTTGIATRGSPDLINKSPAWYLDGTSGTSVYECLFQIPTLSVTAQQFQVTFGLISDTSLSAATNAIEITVDSKINANFICKCISASTASSTTTSLAAVAGTYYYARIVITGNASVSFYIAALGNTWTSAVATIVTNIPASSSKKMSPTFAIKKAAGTTAETARLTAQNFYQRRAA